MDIGSWELRIRVSLCVCVCVCACVCVFLSPLSGLGSCYSHGVECITETTVNRAHECTKYLFISCILAHGQTVGPIETGLPAIASDEEYLHRKYHFERLPAVLDPRGVDCGTGKKTDGPIELGLPTMDSH
jgi:hypothetical protein